ncbi:MAG: nucleotidyltransferase family protein [Chitinophagaceae bacterium]|nr:nucleotidyltransferase family protein [Chitinophagaceae bacterium]MDP1811316.1 nucleotidyltransferase family protein [Sediminibacterium sp.]MDP3128051.1 nucleotidyltransferase family protein [Sediminibacterium sp.]
MPVKEAIILAGGLGTRLRDAVPDLPKCMAPVNNQPFISYVITHLQKQGIERFIFSLGYRSEAFTNYLSEYLPEGNYQLVIEKEPLGTGGAIQLACTYAHDQQVVVVNGDSIFKTNLVSQAEFHEAHQADCTLALKAMENFERYGVVELNPDQRIALFKEKQFYKKGLINGGVYILNREAFLKETLPDKCSFETDYLQKYYGSRKIYGMEQQGYFIDIGIPEDYLKAQTELTN